MLYQHLIFKNKYKTKYKMKSRLEKVYSKLPNQKVNLKAHKVALGLIDNFDMTSVPRQKK